MKKYFLFVMPVAIIALVAFSLKKSSHSKTAYSNERIIECAAANNWWQIAPQFQPAAPSAILVRKNFNSLSKWEMLNLNYAIKQMKIRSQNNINDPLGWSFQVKIHNSPYPDGSLSETCQHGNCFFLAWHRMYLFFFERILFKHMRNNWPKPSGLPYWNNANANPSTSANTIIPIMFRKSTTSMLFWPPYVTQSNLRHSRNLDYNRVGTISNPVWPIPAYVGSDYNNALNYTNYYDFQDALENAHGAVHNLLGVWNDANNNTILYDMFDGTKAANDPIFFFHHANVDRYWELWLAKGQKRKNPGSDCDKFWWDKRFEFYDSTGKKVSLQGKDIVEISNKMMMNYKYFGITSIKFEDTACDKINKLPDCPKAEAIIVIPTPDTKIYGPVGKIVFNLKAAGILKKLEELDKTGLKNQYDIYAEFSDITYKNPPTGIEVYINPSTTEPADLNSGRNDYAASIDLFTPKAVSEHDKMRGHKNEIQPYVQRIKITDILKQKKIGLLNLYKAELVLLFRGGSTPNGWLNGGDLEIGKAAISVYPKR